MSRIQEEEIKRLKAEKDMNTFFKMIKELCIEFPNDTDLGKNMRELFA